MISVALEATGLPTTEFGRRGIGGRRVLRSTTFLSALIFGVSYLTAKAANDRHPGLGC